MRRKYRAAKCQTSESTEKSEIHVIYGERREARKVVDCRTSVCYDANSMSIPNPNAVTE